MARYTPGVQTLGHNHDWWPEKVIERHMREVKHPAIVLTQEDCDRHIDALLERSKIARETREVAKREAS